MASYRECGGGLPCGGRGQGVTINLSAADQLTESFAPIPEDLLRAKREDKPEERTTSTDSADFTDERRKRRTGCLSEETKEPVRASRLPVSPSLPLFASSVESVKSVDVMLLLSDFPFPVGCG